VQRIAHESAEPVAAWRHSSVFTDAERAALALTETLREEQRGSDQER